MIQGSESSILGKEGFGVEKSPFSLAMEKGVLSSRIRKETGGFQRGKKNGQNMHGFQVRTPILHIVPVSRAYPTIPPPPQSTLVRTKGGCCNTL